MSVAVFPSEAQAVQAAPQQRLAAIRANAGVRVATKAIAAVTGLADLSEHGGYRAKFPTVAGRGIEVVLVNTGGGVAGGDRVAFEIAAGEATLTTVATAAAERIYRALDAPARIDVRLSAAHGSTLAWLPQGTILFSGARVERRFDVNMTSTSRVLMAETTVFGRIESGEVMKSGLLQDRWRIRRDGRLVFADQARLSGHISGLLHRPAVASGSRCFGLLVCLGPDLGERLDPLRNAVASLDGTFASSAWNGMLVMRAQTGHHHIMQEGMRRAIAELGLAPVPATWRC